MLRNTDTTRSSRHAHHYLATFPSLLDTEYVLPVERAVEAYQTLVEYVDHYRGRAIFPINMALHARFIKGSDAYLSPTAGRESVCIEAATGASCGYTVPFYTEWGNCMMSEFDARPHWGKGFYNLPAIRQQYASTLPAFEQVRRQFDPEGMFLNETMQEVLGIKEP